MALTVVSVAYPFATAGPDAVGGAEQALAAIDSALTRAFNYDRLRAVAEGLEHCARAVGRGRENPNPSDLRRLPLARPPPAPRQQPEPGHTSALHEPTPGERVH